MNFKRQGHGRLFFPDGRVYEGEFINDKRQGVGTIKWPDLREYTGEFLNDKMHGNGVYQQGSEKFEGVFENGKFLREKESQSNSKKN